MDISCGRDSNYIIQSFHTCFGKNNMNPLICNGRGICKEYNECSCEENYFGIECQIINCFGKLSNQTNVCSGIGNCTESNICACPNGYGGAECQIPITNETSIYSAGYNQVISFNF
jgi:hypothetical protein